MFSTDSIFKNFFSGSSINVMDVKFRGRLQQLEELMKSQYDVTAIENGWRCKSRFADKPGFIITPETVLHVMKNLGI